MSKIGFFTAALLLCCTGVYSSAEARCEVAPANGGASKSCGGGGSTRSSSNSNSNAAAAFALGSVLLQGLQNSESDVQAELNADHERYQRKMRAAERLAVQSEASAVGAAGTNPWGGSKARGGQAGGRAPYANASCATFVQPSKGKVDWDYVTIQNKCGFPIQVITCYHLQGEESTCKRPSAWGTTSTIKPGSKTTSVSTTKTWPFQVKHVVCNMAEAKKNGQLCLRPS